MATRNPLVLVAGELKELPSGDTIAGSVGTTAAYTRTTYTTTAAQTTFAAAYTVGYVDVYLNGNKLITGTDFSASDGASVVLTVGAAVGDTVELTAYSLVDAANVYTKTEVDGMVATKGTASVSFGGGASDASVFVSAPAITAGKLVQAWVLPAITASNTADDHRAEDLTVFAGGINAGVGFTIYVRCNTLRAHGIFNIAWSIL